MTVKKVDDFDGFFRYIIPVNLHQFTLVFSWILIIISNWLPLEKFVKLRNSNISMFWKFAVWNARTNVSGYKIQLQS